MTRRILVVESRMHDSLVYPLIQRVGDSEGVQVDLAETPSELNKILEGDTAGLDWIVVHYNIKGMPPELKSKCPQVRVAAYTGAIELGSTTVHGKSIAMNYIDELFREGYDYVVFNRTESVLGMLHKIKGEKQ